MCGIAGIISDKLKQNNLVSRLEAMQKALQHRGPDSQGQYLSPSPSTSTALLTHTRLAIIDLSPQGAQPMSTQDGRYIITYNGEIYNYKSLQKELSSQGWVFHSDSDTEVILALYTHYGEQCLNKLRGMFAFVIWDTQEQTAFAARDPLGIKPFYYWHDAHTISFASEMKAVIAAGFSQQSLSTQGVFSYLKSGSVSEPNTLIDDIQLLQAGHCLTWHQGHINTRCYWHMTFPAQTMSYNEAISITRTALEESVKAHFVSDVPVGIFLSGGIDSTALLALAKQVTSHPLRTYSIAFEDPAWNEGDIAKRVAAHFGTHHTELVMTAELARPLFTDFLAAVDQPSIDGFNTFCVAKLAHDHGEKVVLSGLGGDEIFAGYKSFKILPKMLKLSRCLALLRPVISGFNALSKRWLSPRLRRLLDCLCQPNSLPAAHQSLRGIFSNDEARALTSLLSPQALIAPQSNKDEQIKWPANTQDRISQLELSTYMRNQLLRDSDINSMAWGLELRVPFVDHILLDRLSHIPSEYRLQYGKQLLIDSVPEVPEWVFNRPKQGFRFPFDEWFESEWQQRPLSLKPPRWISLSPWYRRWSLTLLSHWIKRDAT